MENNTIQSDSLVSSPVQTVGNVETMSNSNEMSSAEKLLIAFDQGNKEAAAPVSLKEIQNIDTNIKINELRDKFSKPKNKNKKSADTNFKPSAALLVAPSGRAASTYIQKAFKDSKSLNEVDGVDHINMSHFANTRLGKFLDINAYTPFYHRELLNFNSVGGLWYFVKCVEPTETFRYLHGSDCRAEARKHAIREVEGFKTIIADATWIKINTNKQVIADIIDSDLPFKSYFYSGEFNMKKSTPESIWYIEAVETIRRTLKEIDATGNQSLLPDFSHLEKRNFSF